MKILCGEYENPIIFSKKELKTIFEKIPPRPCDFPWVITEVMDDFTKKFSRETCISGTGTWSCAPTGEEFVKICFYADTIVDAESIMIYLLIDYQEQSKREGKRFLYWRSKPCFVIEGKKK